VIPQRLLRPLLVLLSVMPPLLLGACGRGEGAPMSDDTFVRVMVDLRRAAAVTSSDTSGFVVMRDSILDAAGVSDSALYAWINATSSDPERIGRVFREIRDSMRVQPDTVPQ